MKLIIFNRYATKSNFKIIGGSLDRMFRYEFPNAHFVYDYKDLLKYTKDNILLVVVKGKSANNDRYYKKNYFNYTITWSLEKEDDNIHRNLVKNRHKIGIDEVWNIDDTISKQAGAIWMPIGYSTSLKYTEVNKTNNIAILGTVMDKHKFRYDMLKQIRATIFSGNDYTGSDKLMGKFCSHRYSLYVPLYKNSTHVPWHRISLSAANRMINVVYGCDLPDDWNGLYYKFNNPKELLELPQNTTQMADKAYDHIKRNYHMKDLILKRFNVLGININGN